MFSSDTICYFNAGSSDTAELLGNYLSKILIKNGFSDIAPVLLCIGSDRVTGDSLGPMVGSALEERYKKAIEEIITINELQAWTTELNNNDIDGIIRDIDIYYKLEMNMDAEDEEE